MDFKEVKDLIKMIDCSNLTEFELHLGNAYVKMSKNGSITSTCESKGYTAFNKGEAVFSRESVMDDIKEPITIIPEEKPVVVDGNIVKSPLVGTFYESPGSDKPPFVAVGSTVKVGDILCIVEAMKVMNEITSQHDGQIVEVLVINEAMVEFNQPIFRIV